LPSLLLLLLFSLCFFFFFIAAPTSAAAVAEDEVLTEADVPDMVAQGEEWVNKRMFDEAKVRGCEREGGLEGEREGGREGAWDEEGIQGRGGSDGSEDKKGCWWRLSA
jgi:hypothetical protein